MQEKFNKVIVGLGKTGLAVAKFLAAKNMEFAITDNRQNPPGLAPIQNENYKVKTGKFDEDLILQASEIILSPGVSLKEPILQKAQQNKIPIYSEIELFARYVKAPVCAITGSNAKSTVTALVYAMAQKAGLNVRIGGNFGTPALELLSETEPDLYVLELSSFQLETTYSLQPQVATILNISPDHLDRYDDLAEYIAAKQRIYHGAKIVVSNRDDKNSWLKDLHSAIHISFGSTLPKGEEFGLMEVGKKFYLAFGKEKLLCTEDLILKGKHNWLNALAALALGHGLKLPLESMLMALKEFAGLPHRCQMIAKINNVVFINDSKGTNVGATIAAISGIGDAIVGQIILIAGGLGKDADFNDLNPVVQKYVSKLILIGRDATKIAAALQSVAIEYAPNLQKAVQRAAMYGKPGDVVLLSPACASYDMFHDYEDRGNQFIAAVEALN